jgi:FkbM family methyltransferase
MTAGPQAELLIELLRPERPTAVVDIGASPLDGGDPPYKALLQRRLCSLIGFEPQPEALTALQMQKSDIETYLPYAVGDGGKSRLNVCRATGMTSLLAPNNRVLKCFPGFENFGEVLSVVEVETRTLDSIDEIAAIDLLKIDVQGAELQIFRNGSRKLSNAVAIQTEVSFVPLYVGQPLFGDIDLALRALGYVPHMFTALNRRMILPIHVEGDMFSAINQLLEADVVYVRDFTRPENMTSEQLRHLAIIAHYCYGSFDLTARCIDQLQARNEVHSGAMRAYLDDLKTLFG